MKKRCTFAIISHPDAGKTTITEKLLWFGRQVRKTGMVKSKQGNYAKSDWMEMEQERGISISSSVMSFPYQNRDMHLLDTPGHKDFSEDTYRTLTAVESVLMMIDSAKGVEEQTLKLMEVCRMRKTPIVTFMNKFDRDTQEPFELIDNIEEVCKIECAPLTWPIGSGVDFKGVYDLRDQKIRVFDDKGDPDNPRIIDGSNLESAEIKEFVPEDVLGKFKEELEMVQGVLPQYNERDFLAGKQTPVFFGSALYNFGVNETLNFISQKAPAPLSKEVLLEPFDENSPKETINPDDKEFSGFIFKIQANMDKRHRDRVAFMRICSGSFKRGGKIFHVRSSKEIKMSTPLMFLAEDREVTEEAFPGDIIGLHDTGKLKIGDTFSEGRKIQFTGIPSFSPEIFNKVILKDPLKSKQLEKGLNQLSEEGTVQLFTRHTIKEKILGAVGPLQFEVVKQRLETEYGVQGEYQSYPFVSMRWLRFPSDKVKERFIADNGSNICYDHKKRICFSVRSPWDLKLAQEKNEDVEFFKNSDYKK